MEVMKRCALLVLPSAWREGGRHGKEMEGVERGEREVSRSIESGGK